MKKIFKTLAIVAVAALGLTACENDINEQVNGNEGEKVTVEVVGSIADLTRSAFGTIDTENKTVPSTWSGNEQVGFSVNEGALVDATNTEAGANAVFTTELDVEVGDTVYAFAPYAESYAEGGIREINSSYSDVTVNVPASQTPLVNSVDESAHLMAGEATYNGGGVVNMTFNHIAAYGKMNLVLPEGVTADLVTITFPKAVVGTNCYYYYETSTWDKANGTTITIDPQNVENNVYWFTVVPTGDLTEGDIVVNVIDGVTTYTKTITLTAEKKLGFIKGQVSNFTVNMSSVVGVEPVFGLANAEIASTMAGVTGNSYQNVSIESTSGVWTANVYGDKDNALQFRAKSGSYVLSPVFEKYVESIVINFEGSTTDGRSVYAVPASVVASLPTSAEYSDAQYATNYGFVTTTSAGAQSLTLTFNSSVKQFALLAKGGAVYVESIEVNLTDAAIIPTLPTPVVTATADGNAINVSWDAIEGAGNYTVTWDGGTETTPNNSYRIENLEYSTSYTISVVANTADANVNKSSLAGTATATTAIDPAEATKNYSKMTSWEADLDGKYLLVVESKSKYLTSVSNNIGNGSDITINNNVIAGTAVDGSAVLSLEEGATAGTYSFKMGDVYLALTAADNKLHTSTTKNNNSSWTISIADGNATITNVAYADRSIRWNAGSPRFACYTSAQTAIQIYKRDAVADTRPEAVLAFSQTEITLTVGEEFTAPTLTFDGNEVQTMAGLSYTSSNTNVATVGETNGVIALKEGATGTTTITATFAGDENYKPATAECTITVKAAAGDPTTVTMSTFSAKSANMDGVISYTCAQGGGTSAPAINGGEIRLYQKNGGGAGGYITISAKTGYKITSITIGSSMKTTLGYGVDSDSASVTSQSLAAGGKFTLDDINAEDVTFYCYGTDKNTRLYVNYLSVTYVAE